MEFTITTEELGFFILCQVIAIHSRGRKSPPFITSTQTRVERCKTILSIVYPGDPPTLTSPEHVTTGMVLTTNVPKPRASDGLVKWQREVDGQWIDVLTMNQFLVTASDVGSRIRVTAKGDRISQPTKIIELAPTIKPHARVAIKSLSFRFRAVNKSSPGTWTMTGNSNGLTIKSTSGAARAARWNSIKCESVPGTVDEILLWIDAGTKFPLVPSLSDDPRLESILGSNNVRDYVVTVIRSLAEHSSQ
jgi:hypothetical protein